MKKKLKYRAIDIDIEEWYNGTSNSVGDALDAACRLGGLKWYVDEIETEDTRALFIYISNRVMTRDEVKAAREKMLK